MITCDIRKYLQQQACHTAVMAAVSENNQAQKPYYGIIAPGSAPKDDDLKQNLIEAKDENSFVSIAPSLLCGISMFCILCVSQIAESSREVM